MPQNAEHNIARTHIKCAMICILFVLLFPPQKTLAVTACVSNDALAVVLDKNITPSYSFPEGAHISSDSSGTWYATINGLKVYGSSACVSTNRHFDEHRQLWDGDTLVQNEHSNGNICYCRLIVPVVSEWRQETTFPVGCSNWACQGDCTPRKCKYQCSYVATHGSFSSWVQTIKQ